MDSNIELIESTLPKEDIKKAIEYYNKGYYNELSMLINSDEIFIEKQQRRKLCPVEYKDINLRDLLVLKNNIDRLNIEDIYE